MKTLKQELRKLKIQRWVDAVLFVVATFLTPLSWLQVSTDPKNYWHWFFAIYFTFLLLRLNKGRS